MWTHSFAVPPSFVLSGTLTFRYPVHLVAFRYVFFSSLPLIGDSWCLPRLGTMRMSLIGLRLLFSFSRVGTPFNGRASPPFLEDVMMSVTGSLAWSFEVKAIIALIRRLRPIPGYLPPSSQSYGVQYI